MDGINDAYETVRQTAGFQEELADLYAHYVGWPSPIFHAKRLSARQGGADTTWGCNSAFKGANLASNRPLAQ